MKGSEREEERGNGEKYKRNMTQRGAGSMVTAERRAPLAQIIATLPHFLFTFYPPLLPLLC